MIFVPGAALIREHKYIVHLKVLNNLLACVASISNRVIGRKLERKQKKGCRSCFFCSCPSFLDEPCEETLATQATARDTIGD